MKTSCSILAVLATVFFTQSATAKLGANRSTMQLEKHMEINVEAEIVGNINDMLANIHTSSIKDEVTKQLSIGTVQSQTNELVQNIDATLPEFKFKVVLAD